MSLQYYEFIRGPLTLGVVLLVVGGLLFRIWQFFHATIRQPATHAVDNSMVPSSPPAETGRRRISALWHTLRTHFKNTIFSMNPVVVWITAVYHGIIFAALVFVEGHNVLLDLSWGISLPSVSEATMNTLTLVLLAISLFYLIRRGVLGKMRFPVIVRDYLAILITAMPFVTGYLAYQQWFDYTTIMICHMLSGHLFLLALPFSKLGHGIFFFFGRFCLSGELNLLGGRRYWRNNFPLARLPRAAEGDAAAVDTALINNLLNQKRTQMKVMLAFCARCSNCAESCFLYQQTGDPSYIPSHKVFDSLGFLYRCKGRVARPELEDMVDTIWNKCVLCERCYCPVGLKIPDMIALARSICRSQGVFKTYDSPDA